MVLSFNSIVLGREVRSVGATRRYRADGIKAWRRVRSHWRPAGLQIEAAGSVDRRSGSGVSIENVVEGTHPAFSGSSGWIMVLAMTATGQAGLSV